MDTVREPSPRVQIERNARQEADHNGNEEVRQRMDHPLPSFVSPNLQPFAPAVKSRGSRFHREFFGTPVEPAKGRNWSRAGLTVRPEVWWTEELTRA
jgi:hypothetical protein